MNKLKSGRFLLTIFGGLGFLYMIYVGTLPAETSAAIITMIFVSYFNKNGGGNGKTD